MFNKPKQIKTKSAGFTLIEMLVSLSLFTIVVTMSVGTLLILINANGIAQGMQLVMTNLSFTLDSMTREIRTSTDWYCGTHGNGQPNIPTADGSSPSATSDCVAGSEGNYLSIVESGDSLTEGLGTRRITYFYDYDYYGSGHGAILRKLGGFSGTEGTWVPLTGEDIAIDTMEFRVNNTSRYVHTSDLVQPTATIFIRGRAGFDSAGQLTGPRVKVFELQTTITQRLLDI